MQKINYNERIELEDKIEELLMINIDDKLNQSIESDCIKVYGEINVSGEVKTDKGTLNFNHPISVDILLSKEQLVEDRVNISIDDFNYQIEESSILIELITKIDGLKEIEAYFPAQEDQEDTKIEEPIIMQDDRNEAIENIIDIKEEIQTIQEDSQILQEPIVEKDANTDKEVTTKYSLLQQVFKNRNIKKETSYLLHVVKNETSYNEIAAIYNVDSDKLKSLNKDEEIYKGKLIFIPKI